MFREPTDEEKLFTKELIGCHIDIFWDGDNVFYPAMVVGYEEENRLHKVLYDNDDTNQEYLEDLKSTVWRIWDETLLSVEVEEKFKREELHRECKIDVEGLYAPPAPIKTSESKLSYSAMTVEAVYHLAEKNGSSLQSIRKYILQHFPLKAQQTASFNALTLKAVNKAVAQNELERLRNTFKLTSAEKERRKMKERKSTYSSDSKHTTTKRSDDDKMSRFSSLYGSILESNKVLRKTWEIAISKRDKFLENHVNYILPFLPEKNYFSKKQKVSSSSSSSSNNNNNNNNNNSNIKGHQNSNINNTNNNSSSNQIVVLNDSSYSASSSIDHPYNSVKGLENQPLIHMDTNPSISTFQSKVNDNDDTMEHIIEPSTDIGTEDSLLEETSEAIDINNISSNRELDISVLSLVQTNRALKGVEILIKPPTLQADLHDYQVQGISWMVHMFKHGMPMILGDQMGLGKTLQSIGFLACLQHYSNLSGPHLIVVPLSVLSNWISEIERFCPTFRAVRFHGPKDERNRIKMEELSDMAEFDIVVTTFEMLVSEANFFRRKYMWTTVIVDEGHRLKNDKSQLSEKLRMVPTICKVILTGTPLQNNLRELWALLHFLAPEIFTTQSADLFDEGFDLLRRKVDATVLRNARKLLNIFMLRRLKDQVNIKLPSKKEITLVVSLTEKQTEWYKQLLCGLDKNLIEIVMKESTEAESGLELLSGGGQEVPMSTTLSVVRKRGRSKKEVELLSGKSFHPKNNDNDDDDDDDNNDNNNGHDNNDNDDQSVSQSNGASDWRKLMNLLLQLRKVCNHTYLMPDGAPYPYQITEDIVQGSGKLLLLDRMLPRLREDNHRVLIFSQFTSMLDILEDYCDLRQWPYVRLDGNTNRVQRRLDVRRFNASNSQIFIFLISTRAGGLGLNLASADTVILYDSDWNPQVDIQAMERAHRIGQTKPVRVFRLVCRGSVEERMVSRADKKLFLNAMVAEADPDTDIAEDTADSEDDMNQQADNEVTHALGVTGPAISKRELSSLIRFGANAVIDGSKDNSENQISDNDLDVLLERSGRDKSVDSIPSTLFPIIATSSSSSGSSSSSSSSSSSDMINPTEILPTTDLSSSELSIRVSKDVLASKFEEVDLRQLGNFVYSKKKSSNSKINEQSLQFDFLDGKRKRIERIKMVDGKGTGYGSAVPILTSNLDEPTIVISSTFPRRTREWTHQSFCCLCGKSKELNGKLRCAHCPRVFHISCISQYESIWKGSGMFICPHHKCAGCGRSTASSGGLLFRCVSCLTSYCEDCLPQDDIESIGRCKELEMIGYESKQSYFIKCPACIVHRDAIQLSNEMTTTTTTATTSRSMSMSFVVEETKNLDHKMNGEIDETDSTGIPLIEKEEVNSNGQTDENQLIQQQEAILFPTQLMRIHLQEVPDTPPKPKNNRKYRSKQSKKRERSSNTRENKRMNGHIVENDQPESSKRRRSSRFETKVSIDLDEEIENVKIDKDLDIEDGKMFTLDESIGLLLNKAETMRLFVFDVTNKKSIYDSLSDRIKQSRTNQWVSIVTKVYNGRYRSASLFITDVHAYLTQIQSDVRNLLIKDRSHNDNDDVTNKLKEEMDGVVFLIEYFERTITDHVMIE